MEKKAKLVLKLIIRILEIGLLIILAGVGVFYYFFELRVLPDYVSYNLFFIPADKFIANQTDKATVSYSLNFKSNDHNYKVADDIIVVDDFEVWANKNIVSVVIWPEVWGVQLSDSSKLDVNDLRVHYDKQIYKGNNIFPFLIDYENEDELSYQFGLSWGWRRKFKEDMFIRIHWLDEAEFNHLHDQVSVLREN